MSQSTSKPSTETLSIIVLSLRYCIPINVKSKKVICGRLITGTSTIHKSLLSCITE